MRMVKSVLMSTSLPTILTQIKSSIHNVFFNYRVGLSLKVENDRMIVSRVLEGSASHLSGTNALENGI